jgi:hypothetical protein
MTFTKGHPRYGGMQRGQVVSIKREAFERLTYINDVPRAGGFSLILANQHYPLLSEIVQPLFIGAEMNIPLERK